MFMWKMKSPFYFYGKKRKPKNNETEDNTCFVCVVVTQF